MKKLVNKKIGVIGLWHLGCIFSVGFAKCGYSVEGYDTDRKVVNNLKIGKAPVFEPDLDQLINDHLRKNLSFTNDANTFFKDKDYIFITYDIPVDKNDRVNTKVIDETIDLIKRFGDVNTVYVISSQIMLGTSRDLMNKINGDDSKAKVIYFPENVRLGKGLETFLKPDRIILGSDNDELMDKFIKDFGIFDCQFIKMGLESAEMVKHALNSYLATCVSYSSEISDLCELLGADMRDVVSALKTDRRVSPYAPISPGLGFAGATLGRDVQSLQKLGKQNGYKAKLFKTVYQVNQDRLPWLIKKIKSIKPKLKDVEIGILGLTYKPGTNTLRRSMSMELVNLLHIEGAEIRAFDPVISEPIKGYDYLTISKNYDEFYKNLQIVVLMTEWPEFLDMPITEKSKLMKEKIFVDTKNFMDKEKLVKSGFVYKGTGF